mgnify:CR=1 FL=1
MSNDKTYIIAELSANHNHDLEIALKTLKAMHDAGADALKVQTFTPDSMTLNENQEIFMARKDSLWKGKKLYDLYREAALPYEWHEKLKAEAENLGLDFFSTPFDIAGVDFLEKLKVPAYKIASLEINHIPLIEYVASKKKPMIISTGIATLADIEMAVNVCRKVGNNDITLLKCTSAYPAPIEEANLRNIATLKQMFNVKAGLSDHTLSLAVPGAAVAMGATVIEKHFILERSMGGVDAAFSLDKNEFSTMVKIVRETEKALGSDEYQVTEKMKKASISSRSIIVSENILSGQNFSEQNIKVLRPGYGLHPSNYNSILGRKARSNIMKGTPLTWEMIA